MKTLITSAALAIALSHSATAESYQTGLADLSIADADRPLSGFVWYPTHQIDGATRQHNNPVWTGIEAIADATPTPGAHPLVVLSHGMYGNAMGPSWMADDLARAGYVVAAVNHPGTSTWERDPDDARELWERPRDISRVIDAMLADPALNIDPDRIYMGGHSLGGLTAAWLAGAQYDDAYKTKVCDANPGELVCGILDMWNIGKTPADLDEMARDHSDARIRAFALFDLGGTQIFSPSSLAAIDSPLLVIGAPNNVEGQGVDLDHESRALVAKVSADIVEYHEPAGLSHFDFLGECTDQALDVLKAEEPDDLYVCFDGTDGRRARHAVVMDAVLGFFAEN